MTPDDPRHGEGRGYYAHIAAGQDVCGPCNEAIKRHRRRRGKLRTMGVPGVLPIGEKLHARLRAARSRGMTHKQIAEAMGVSLSCAWRYCEEGPDLKVSFANWKKIAAFRPQSVLTYVGMVRRVQALHHLGYGCAAIALEAGCHKETLQEALRCSEHAGHRVRASIAATYDRLWNTPCTGTDRVTSRAKNRALREGWAPAMAWDDDTIDDPTARPVGLKESGRSVGMDEVAILRRIGGDQTVQLRSGEAIELVHRMRADGHTTTHIEAVTGVNASRVLHDLRRRERDRAARQAQQESTSEENAA